MHIYRSPLPANVTLSAGVGKQVASVITPATRRAQLLGFFFRCDSVTASDGQVLVEAVQFDADGTAAGAITPRAEDPADPAALCTVKYDYGAGTLANTGEVVRDLWSFPAQGVIGWREIPGGAIVVPVSKILVLRLTAPEGQVVRGSIRHAE